VWPSLGELLELVAHDVPATRPAGRTIAIGHSAAHRTLEAWLDEAGLDTVALVDAAYGELSRYRAWLRHSKLRRLIDIGAETRWQTDRFHRSLPKTRVIVR
jgi:hypothetical protein